MTHKLCLVLPVIITTTLLLAACGPGAAPVQPTTAPAATAAASTSAAALLDGSSMNVGLVTDTGGVNDQSLNQLAWEGVQKAAKDMGFQAKFVESKQPIDVTSLMFAEDQYGFYQPDEGEISIQDQPVTMMNPQDAIKKALAWFTSTSCLMPPLTVTENILLGKSRPLRVPGLLEYMQQIASRIEERTVSFACER